MLSKIERTARNLFAHYLPHDPVVYNLRPEWLVNLGTTHAAELDIFLPKLMPAIELSGEPHGRSVPGMPKTFHEFEKQQSRDMLKVTCARKRGIELHKPDRFGPSRRRSHLISPCHFTRSSCWAKSPRGYHSSTPATCKPCPICVAK